MTQLKAKAVLARLIQRFDFQLLSKEVGLRMGARLEPRGLKIVARRRNITPVRAPDMPSAPVGERKHDQ